MQISMQKANKSNLRSWKKKMAESNELKYQQR